MLHTSWDCCEDERAVPWLFYGILALEDGDGVQKYRITGCAVVWDQKQRVLLKQDPKRGWELPGGHVEPGETIPACVLREVKEETGIDIEIIEFCGISQDVRNHVCHTFWMAKYIGGQLALSSESLDAGFFDVEDAFRMIQRQDFRDELRRCLDKGERPFFISLGGAGERE